MVKVDISSEQARALRELFDDDYLFRQLRYRGQKAIEGIVDQLPLLEDGIYLYVAGPDDTHFLYFVRDGRFSTELNTSVKGSFVTGTLLNNWTRIADLPA